MTPLHRHQLVHLNDAGWARVCARPWDEAAAQCLGHWAAHRLPLVVTRRTPGQHDPDLLALGLAAPARWQRRRIALTVERRDIAWFDEFPLAATLAPLLPLACRTDWQRLVAALAALGATTRVHGSHGWQWLSRLDHVHARSDIDLWVAVDNAVMADAVAAELDSFSWPDGPRLDGELVFPDGRALAWREWRLWRTGRCRAILVKSLDGVALVEARMGADANAGADAAVGQAPAPERTAMWPC